MTEKLKIYIALPYFDNATALQTFGKYGDIEIRSSYPRPSEQELCELAAKYNVLVIGIQEKITEHVVNCGQGVLKYVCSLSVGLDHIRTDLLKERGIELINTPAANANSVAEFAWMFAYTLKKRMIIARQTSFEGLDRSVVPQISDVRGSKVGIVGFGNTGQAFAQLSPNSASEILVWTRSPERYDLLQDGSFVYATLEKLFSSCDIISIHLPLLEGTENLIDSSLIDLMKKDAILLNVARAKVLDCEYAFEKVQREEILGVAIDDFNSELPVSLPNHPQILITPHLAGISAGALKQMQSDIAVNFEQRYFS